VKIQLLILTGRLKQHLKHRERENASEKSVTIIGGGGGGGGGDNLPRDEPTLAFFFKLSDVKSRGNTLNSPLGKSLGGGSAGNIFE
jgi:hypothetical protein